MFILLYLFIDATVEELLDQLIEPKLVYYDYAQGVPLSEAMNHPQDDFRFWVNLLNKPLTNLYEFMKQNGLVFLYEPVAEMVANASHHGNKRYNSIHNAPNGDPLKSLSVKVFTGRRGILFRVRNEGAGFDHKKMLLHFEEGRHSLNLLGGNGTRILANPGFCVSYEDSGRVTNLLYVL